MSIQPLFGCDDSAANPVNFVNGKRSHVYYNTQPKPQSFLSALYENGNLLGLTCGSSIPSKSKPEPPGTPDSLHPTLLQLSTVHWQWIDRFPFPDFRDEMIIRSGEIDEEDFVGDLFNLDPFTLTPGARSTDPYAYTMNPEFRAKWGYLFPSFSRACGQHKFPSF